MKDTTKLALSRKGRVKLPEQGTSLASMRKDGAEMKKGMAEDMKKKFKGKK